MGRQKVFVYKVLEEDRDCCAYIELPIRRDLIGKVGVCGSCYTCGCSYNYNEVKTFLTEEEFNRLFTANEELKYSNDNSVDDIVEKLQSDEAMRFFETIKEEEIEALEEEYDLSRSDIVYIFNNTPYGYTDRGLVGFVYEDAEDLGNQEAFELGIFSNFGRHDGWIKDIVEKCFDFEAFGNELLESETYLELPSGKIAQLNL